MIYFGMFLSIFAAFLIYYGLTGRWYHPDSIVGKWCDKYIAWKQCREVVRLMRKIERQREHVTNDPTSTDLAVQTMNEYELRPVYAGLTRRDWIRLILAVYAIGTFVVIQIMVNRENAGG